MIAAYVSGHGFGHAARTGEVLRTLRRLDPGSPVTVVGAAPERLFREALPGVFGFRALDCDVGLVQHGALVIDEAATAERCRALGAAWPEMVASEARWLRQSGARVVLGDVPPLAFAAASAAQVPSLGLANFSWDWVYRHLAARQPSLAEAADLAAAAYGRADLLLELPFAGDLGAFPVRERIPLVARRPAVKRPAVRRLLGEAADRCLVLLSFGGAGLPGFEAGSLGSLPGYRFLVTGRFTNLPENVRALPDEELAGLGLGYPDLVGAADVVVTKPGYGIVSDAIGAGTRLVYTDRGDFPEYPILVREMPRHLACCHVSIEDLLRGRLGEALRTVLESRVPEPPRLDGAAVAARRILDRVGRL